MTSEQNTTFSTVAGPLGVKSKASLALYSPAEIFRHLKDAKQECDWSDLQQLHAEAKKEYDDLCILEKSILTRASPLLPKAIRLRLKHPDVSLQDYEEWFGGRARVYANPGEVSSMFSPAAYLTELYREARALFRTDNPWHIDSRRPDLKNLILSQDNMDSEVTALSLSNEILLEKARTGMMASSEDVAELTDDVVLAGLSEHVTSSGTPYHHHHTRLRQVQKQKDPQFTQLQGIC